MKLLSDDARKAASAQLRRIGHALERICSK